MRGWEGAGGLRPGAGRLLTDVKGLVILQPDVGLQGHGPQHPGPVVHTEPGLLHVDFRPDQVPLIVVEFKVIRVYCQVLIPIPHIEGKDHVPGGWTTQGLGRKESDPTGSSLHTTSPPHSSEFLECPSSFPQPGTKPINSLKRRTPGLSQICRSPEAASQPHC